MDEQQMSLLPSSPKPIEEPKKYNVSARGISPDKLVAIRSSSTPAIRKHPGGRPTKYRIEYCQKLISYFDTVPSHETDIITTYGKTEKIETKEVANELPTFERFAANLSVNVDTLYEWGRVHPEFSVSLSRAREMQKHILITNSLKGLYDSRFAIFLATNITDLKNRTITEEMGERKVIVEHRDYVSERQNVIEAETVEP